MNLRDHAVPTPHDHGGSPCLPSYHPRSRRAWPRFAIPARSRKPSPAPARLPGRRPRPTGPRRAPPPLVAILALAAAAVLAGVCGGLAQYFNADATLIRVLFVVLALLGGPGIVIYLLMRRRARHSSGPQFTPSLRPLRSRTTSGKAG